VPGSVAGKLYACGSGASAGRCTPDNLIRAGGNVDPPNCVPFGGTAATSNDGRCLSKCLPDVFNVPTLEQSNCAAGSACAPCYNPATGVNLGTCGAIGCDQAPPGNAFRFPNCCSGQGTCVPQSQLTGSQIANLGRAGCPSPVYMCAPRDQVEGLPLNYCHVSVSIFGSYDSVCVPDCVIDGGGDRCTYDPIFGITLFCPSWVIPACGWLPGGWSCPPP